MLEIETKVKNWLAGKQILRRDDILHPVDLGRPPRIKADIITQFIKRTGYTPGQGFAAQPARTPLEWNTARKIECLSWLLTDNKPYTEDEVAHYRINHFWERRLGVGLWLFPSLHPYPELHRLESEKECLDKESLEEYLQEMNPLVELALEERRVLGLPGLISCILVWRQRLEQKWREEWVVASGVDVVQDVQCHKCRQLNWELKVRSFGGYYKCKTPRCRGTKKAYKELDRTCPCGNKMYLQIGRGGRLVCVCSAYPRCENVYFNL